MKISLNPVHKTPRAGLTVKKDLMNYCQITLHISFRVFWFCNIVAGLVLMFIFINPIYTKWSTNPTIVSPESTNYAIWNIYFPAVTICSNNKVLDGQLQRIVKKAPWVNMTANSTAIPNFNKLKGLKNAISNTILYEVEPHRLRSGNLNSSDEYLLNNHKSQIPKAMQQVWFYHFYILLKP